jgi:hypothetical protein
MNEVDTKKNSNPFHQYIFLIFNGLMEYPHIHFRLV